MAKKLVIPKGKLDANTINIIDIPDNLKDEDVFVATGSPESDCSCAGATLGSSGYAAQSSRAQADTTTSSPEFYSEDSAPEGFQFMPRGCRCSPPQSSGELEPDYPDGGVPDFEAAREQMTEYEREYRFFENTLRQQYADFESTPVWLEKERMLDQLDYLEADEILNNLIQFQRCRRRLDYDSVHIGVTEF